MYLISHLIMIYIHNEILIQFYPGRIIVTYVLNELGWYMTAVFMQFTVFFLLLITSVRARHSNIQTNYFDGHIFLMSYLYYIENIRTPVLHKNLQGLQDRCEVFISLYCPFYWLLLYLFNTFILYILTNAFYT